MVGLFTTVNQAFERVAMHGARLELLRQQAQSAGLPLHIIPIAFPCSDAEYAEAMTSFIGEANRQRIDCFAFGDLFLEDIRRYREERLQGTGIVPIFPLWGMPTEELSQSMVEDGLKAAIACVDPCGENGEFHSFAFNGPMFQNPIEIVMGDTVHRDGFVFTDLLPFAPGAPE